MGFRKHNKRGIRVCLKAFDHRVLDEAVRGIVLTAERLGASIAGPIPLPTLVEKFTVNRSPHVDKKSREQFEVCTHSRVIDVLDLNQQILDAMKSLDISAGVHVEVKLLGVFGESVNS